MGQILTFASVKLEVEREEGGHARDMERPYKDGHASNPDADASLRTATIHSCKPICHQTMNRCGTAMKSVSLLIFYPSSCSPRSLSVRV